MEDRISQNRTQHTFQDYNTYFTLGGCVGFVLFFQQEISKHFGNVETQKVVK